MMSASNCRLHDLLLVRGPIFPTNGLVAPPQHRPFCITPAAPPPPRSSSTSATPKRRYSCPKCPYSTDRRDLYTRHENIHRDEKPFRCYVCEKMFNRADHVKKHFLRIHKGVDYDVKLTKRIKGRDYDVRDVPSVGTLTSPVQIPKVANSHPNPMQLPTTCFQSNPMISELLYKRAMVDSMQIPKLSFNCPNNGNKFSHLQYHLQKPIQNHFSTKLYNLLQNQSTETNKIVQTNTSTTQLLRKTQSPVKPASRHLIRQTIQEKQEDDYQCEYCGCSFINYPSLHTHRFLFHRYIADTDNHLPYKCAVCGQRSITQRVMIKHMQRHVSFFNSTQNRSKLENNRVKTLQSQVQNAPNSSSRRKQSQPRKIIKTFDELEEEKIDYDERRVEKTAALPRAKFTCKICHKEFKTYTQLIQHQKFSKH